MFGSLPYNAHGWPLTMPSARFVVHYTTGGHYKDLRLAQFLREFRVVSRISHMNIIVYRTRHPLTKPTVGQLQCLRMVWLREWHNNCSSDVARMIDLLQHYCYHYRYTTTGTTSIPFSHAPGHLICLSFDELITQYYKLSPYFTYFDTQTAAQYALSVPSTKTKIK